MRSLTRRKALMRFIESFTMETVTLTVRLPEPLAAKVKAVAYANDQMASEFIRDLIRAAVKDLPEGEARRFVRLTESKAGGT